MSERRLILTASPRRGTVKRTAVCRNCNGVLYAENTLGWWHDLTGDGICDEDEARAIQTEAAPERGGKEDQ